ncbi:MAG: hypothetical protein M1826_002253 [Phylliscum demangeonii]|nr:MAG: hypothetical protein M1826_002253 [Phylliscum demangeonii]
MFAGVINHDLYCALCGSPLSLNEDEGRVLYQDEHPEWDDDGMIIPYSGPWIITPDEMKAGEPHRASAPDEPASAFSDCAMLIFYCPSIDGFKASASDLPAGPISCEGSFGVMIGSHSVEVYHHDTESGCASFPVHTACLSIADRIFERRRRQEPADARRSASQLKPTSLDSLYDAINRQSRDRKPEILPCAVNWPHECYGARALQGQSWCWMPGDGTEWLCADPLNVPGLTPFILAQLPPVTEEQNDDGAAAAVAANPLSPPPSPSALECLPTELLEHTLSYLPFADTLALSRTSTRLHHRLLTQAWWRDALIAGDAVGYLWDLDPAQCRAKDTDLDAAAKRWDWRALARHLANRDCFDGAKAGLKEVPRSLRNRQRIWKILVDV